MTELTELCEAVITLEQSNDKIGLDLALSDLRDFIDTLIPRTT